FPIRFTNSCHHLECRNEFHSGRIKTQFLKLSNVSKRPVLGISVDGCIINHLEIWDSGIPWACKMKMLGSISISTLYISKRGYLLIMDMRLLSMFTKVLIKLQDGIKWFSRLGLRTPGPLESISASLMS
ncbi:hypothetical protein GIB67_009329, partial [Kingdonia uniflora]